MKKRAFFIFITGLFALGGAGNMGFSGFAPAIPMLFFLVYAWRNWTGELARFAFGFLLLFVIIDAAKHTGIAGYLSPAFGRHIILNQPMCPDVAEGGAVFFIVEQLNCTNPIPAGTMYRVSKVEISTPEFGETYRLRFPTPYGLGYERPQNHFTWINGTPITENDLVMPGLYQLSLLMVWPWIPMWVDSIKDSCFGPDVEKNYGTRGACIKNFL
jgi:hypothetical protein